MQRHVLVVLLLLTECWPTGGSLDVSEVLADAVELLDSFVRPAAASSCSEANAEGREQKFELIGTGTCFKKHEVWLRKTWTSFPRRSGGAVSECLAMCLADSRCTYVSTQDTGEHPKQLCAAFSSCDVSRLKQSIAAETFKKHPGATLDAELRTDCDSAATLTARATVHADARIGTVRAEFNSLTYDFSRDRGFFDRRLDAPNDPFIFLAKQLSPSILRVGGTGADYLLYVTRDDSDECTEWIARDRLHNECLNSTQWQSVVRFARASGLPLLVNLNARVGLRPGEKLGARDWDPSNAAALLRDSERMEAPLWGCEIGNELDRKVQPSHVVKAADSFRSAGLDEYDGEKLMLVGPDPHSFHFCHEYDAEGGSTPRYALHNERRAWLTEIVERMSERETATFDAFTVHVYTNEEAHSALNPVRVDVSECIAKGTIAAIARAVEEGGGHPRAHEVWAGEVGPHNRGGPIGGTFLATFWYLNALGAFARAGHTLFFRQTFVGVSYGLLRDHRDGQYWSIPWSGRTSASSPNARSPVRVSAGYWVALLHKQLCGRGVLRVDLAGDVSFDARVDMPPSELLANGNADPMHRFRSGSAVTRVFAHCTRAKAPYSRGDITLIVLNLSKRRSLRMPLAIGERYSGSELSGGIVVDEYHGTGGISDDENVLLSTSVSINGHPLELEMPSAGAASASFRITDFRSLARSTTWKEETGDVAITVHPASWAFIVIRGANAAACATIA